MKKIPVPEVLFISGQKAELRHWSFGREKSKTYLKLLLAFFFPRSAAARLCASLDWLELIAIHLLYARWSLKQELFVKKTWQLRKTTLLLASQVVWGVAFFLILANNMLGYVVGTRNYSSVIGWGTFVVYFRTHTCCDPLTDLKCRTGRFA